MDENKPSSDANTAQTYTATDSLRDPQLIAILKNGGVAVIPTDTIFGIVGRADKSETVKRIRELKQRGNDQAFIVLCADLDQVKNFGVDDRQLEVARQHWPAKVSIVIDTDTRFPEITGELEGIGFRVPDFPELQALLRETGPLVAPSANPKNQKPAMTIQEAVNYYEDRIDIYVHGTVADSKPSKLIKIAKDGTQEILRD